MQSQEWQLVLQISYLFLAFVIIHSNTHSRPQNQSKCHVNLTTQWSLDHRSTHKYDRIGLSSFKQKQSNLPPFFYDSLYKDLFTNMEDKPSHREVIDLEDNEHEDVHLQGNYYFGIFELNLTSLEQLKMQFKFKHQLTSSQLEGEDISTIQRNQYQLSKLDLILSNKQLTTSLRKTFGNVRSLALFIKANIENPEMIQIDEQKMTFYNSGVLTAQLFFDNFRVYGKSELEKQMKRFQEITEQSKGAWNYIDQDIVEYVLSDKQILSYLVDAEEETGQAADPENIEESESKSSDMDENQQDEEEAPSVSENHEVEMPPPSQKEPSELSEYQKRQLTFQQVFKQNEVPIFERYRHLNIHCSKKQKIKHSEQMLRIGYCKEDIMKFFSGGAEEMEAEANRIPDYRNPETARYKEIHMIVAKKQHLRHTELLKRHGLSLVPQIPEYSGQIIPANRREVEVEKKIKDLLIRLIKEKQLRRLDLIQLEMRRHGVQATLPFLKKLIEDMKQKSHQRKKMLKINKGSNEISIDD